MNGQVSPKPLHAGHSAGAPVTFQSEASTCETITEV